MANNSGIQLSLSNGGVSLIHFTLWLHVDLNFIAISQRVFVLFRYSYLHTAILLFISLSKSEIFALPLFTSSKLSTKILSLWRFKSTAPPLPIPTLLQFYMTLSYTYHSLIPSRLTGWGGSGVRGAGVLRCSGKGWRLRTAPPAVPVW